METFIVQLVSLITTAVSFGTVIMYGSMGEILTEKSGHLNLGVPGIMYMGGIGGLIGAFIYETHTASPVPAVGLAIALGCSVGLWALLPSVAIQFFKEKKLFWGLMGLVLIALIVLAMFGIIQA